METQQALTTVAIRRETHKQLRAIADKEDRNMQAVVERIIRAGIKAESKVKPS